MRPPVSLVTLAVLALLVALAGACGSGERGGSDGDTDGPTATVTVTTATTAPPSPPPYALDRMVALERPVVATPAPDGRLYVGTQEGRVVLVDPADATTTEVLDRTGETGDPAEFVEAGLLGLAVAPDGGHLYVSDAVPTSDPDDDERAVVRRVEAYRLDGQGGVDEASRATILTLDKAKPVHNGGAVAFGPDGYLYTSVGDGWPFDDMDRTGQDPTDWPGSVLRIDPDPAGGYAVPADNPFADGADGAPEVWVYGLRNPWRFRVGSRHLRPLDRRRGSGQLRGDHPASRRGGGWGQPGLEPAGGKPPLRSQRTR